MKIILEKILEQIDYNNLGNWQMPNLSKFSKNKSLDNFQYQKEALRNITKALFLSFPNESGNSDKKNLFIRYKEYGLEYKEFAINKFVNDKDKAAGIVNNRFKFFQNYFPVLNEYISGANFLNRACFWMATGSGKSIVLIKTIELLDYLQKQNLMPTKEIMLLLPREDLLRQFKREIVEFNKDRERKIELVNLINYEADKQNFQFNASIKVYYYRSDLLRDERKETILDYRSYDNFGNWYIFLDEAHRGEKENSLMQNYVSVLSRNGFLFNFSATFTENIDYATTCFNFNLEKFISQGYGKNLYLNQTYFTFSKEKDEFTQKEQQKQVLKSFIVFTLVKKSKKSGFYHKPLLVTLVNSINTDEPDLLLFFKQIEKIALGNAEYDIFESAKNEIIAELSNNARYVLGQENPSFDIEALKELTISDLLENVFNAKTCGKIELLEGDKEKEIVLKLATTDKPFALIKIGDAKKFQREQLGNNYQQVSSFENKNIFEGINENENINLLLGSRSFYEGWDSNRPNVINMINIGGKDAKKYVLQAIGRGVRIEPIKTIRKRLPINDDNKNILLETLFIFATDKKSINAIVETIKEQKTQNSQEFSLLISQRFFDLLIPVYKQETIRSSFAKFNLSRKTLENFRKYIKNFGKNLLLINHDISLENLNFLLERIADDSFFQIKEDNIYNDMDFLFNRLISHISVKNKVLAGFKALEDEIIHFKHIKVFNLSNEEIELIGNKAQKVKDFAKVSDEEITEKLLKKEISLDTAVKLKNASAQESFRDLQIKKISQHYYLPLIYSNKEKIDYINHIIVNKSEVVFVEALEKYINDNQISIDWQFSKIDETLDKMGMPYFYRRENRYREFFPDFIFWIKKSADYKIIFIDPKGTSHTDYESKIDDFEKLFVNKDSPKQFNYNNMNITIDLKLVAENIDAVGDKYRKYWLGENDFSFLK
ncbi:MAG: DEAD/DEAH box helicase family protein [Elusimicrobiota bacterium]|jgi:superfamily II DNA or RNA helicase|nr:DEAD/DEAH box helicase family protein [Elusimicrobiota bacterium]